MEFPPRDAARPAGPADLAAVASGLGQAVLVGRAVWLREVMPSVRPAEGPFAVQPGRLVSHRLEFSPLRVAPWSQCAPKAQAVFA